MFATENLALPIFTYVELFFENWEVSFNKIKNFMMVDTNPWKELSIDIHQYTP